jgi:hypothetical protein
MRTPASVALCPRWWSRRSVVVEAPRAPGREGPALLRVASDGRVWLEVGLPAEWPARCQPAGVRTHAPPRTRPATLCRHTEQPPSVHTLPYTLHLHKH